MRVGPIGDGRQVWNHGKSGHLIHPQTHLGERHRRRRTAPATRSAAATHRANRTRRPPSPGSFRTDRRRSHRGLVDAPGRHLRRLREKGISRTRCRCPPSLGRAVRLVRRPQRLRSLQGIEVRACECNPCGLPDSTSDCSNGYLPPDGPGKIARLALRPDLHNRHCTGKRQPTDGSPREHAGVPNCSHSFDLSQKHDRCSEPAANNERFRTQPNTHEPRANQPEDRDEKQPECRFRRRQVPVIREHWGTEDHRKKAPSDAGPAGRTCYALNIHRPASILRYALLLAYQKRSLANRLQTDVQRHPSRYWQR